MWWPSAGVCAGVNSAYDTYFRHLSGSWSAVRSWIAASLAWPNVLPSWFCPPARYPVYPGMWCGIAPRSSSARACG